jgi:hypothetical protein
MLISIEAEPGYQVWDSSEVNNLDLFPIVLLVEKKWNAIGKLSTKLSLDF